MLSAFFARLVYPALCYLCHMQAGYFIQSTPLLNGTIFESAVIYITEYNTNGAVGYIINKPFARSLNQLEEFKYSIAFPLYNGGPVDTEHLFFMHSSPGLVKGGMHVAGNIYSGGDFKAAVRLINSKAISAAVIKLFIGYCGWDSGELEAEIAEGSWVVLDKGCVF